MVCVGFSASLAFGVGGQSCSSFLASTVGVHEALPQCSAQWGETMDQNEARRSRLRLSSWKQTGSFSEGAYLVE